MKSYLRGNRYQSEKKKQGGQLPKGSGQNVHTERTAEKLAAEFTVDEKTIVVVGSLDGKLVAEDRTDHHGHAAKIAASWRDSGLEVTISQGKENQ